MLPSIVSSFSSFSFCGSRHGSAGASLFVPAFAAAFSSAPVRVGCARGVDALVRDAFPDAGVFRATGAGRGPLAARSERLVRAGGPAGALLVAFPSTSVPPARCVVGQVFRGGGSGSWGAVALALGLGYPVLVWVPSVVASSVPPLPGLSFVSASSRGAVVVGSWWFSAGAAVSSSPSLFG